MKIFPRIFLFLSIFILAACSAPAVSDLTDAPIGALELNPSVDVHVTSEVKSREDVVLIDVREQWEYDEGHIPGITLIPMGEITSRLQEIPTDKTVIFTCRSGNRSGQVTDYLREQGFTNIHNMEGGILAWQAAGYDVER